MDTELENLLAEVETLVAVRVVVGLLESGLLHDRHDLVVLADHFLHVVRFAATFQVGVAPPLDLAKVFLAWI